MRNVRFAASTLIAWLVLGGAATASTPHTVRSGETLWSIASANGMSATALAAANGLPADANSASSSSGSQTGARLARRYLSRAEYAVPSKCFQCKA
jgi:Tfp pilus assembly protein FimV